MTPLATQQREERQAAAHYISQFRDTEHSIRDAIISADPENIQQERLQGMQKAGEWNMPDLQPQEDSEWSMTDGAREEPEQKAGNLLEEYIRQQKQKEEVSKHEGGIRLDEYIRQQKQKEEVQVTPSAKVGLGCTVHNFPSELLEKYGGEDELLQAYGYSQEIERSQSFVANINEETLEKMRALGIESLAVGEKGDKISVVYKAKDGVKVQNFSSAGIPDDVKGELAANFIDQYLEEGIAKKRAQKQDVMAKEDSKVFYDGVDKAQEILRKTYGPDIKLEVKATGILARGLGRPSINRNEVQKIYMEKDGVEIPIGDILPRRNFAQMKSSEAICKEIVDQAKEKMRLIKN